jgi:enterobactin synthetase component D / holo-[acyl-carrier protein] synthase
VIDRILPAGVSCAEAFEDPPDGWLFPEEMAVVAKAVDKRRREFTTARNCARMALSKLGVPPAAILTGERGAPLWPPGIVGSITHCAGYRAAVVARSDLVITLGVDAEPNEPLPDGVLDAVSTGSDRERLGHLTAAWPGVCWDRLLFSAKESVYKAWFPLARRWLGFEDAEISFNPADGTFRAHLLIAAPVVDGYQLDGFTGRWLAGDGLVLTAIAVPVTQAAGHSPADSSRNSQDPRLAG